MRTIKFRGKDVYGKWLYGSLCVHSDQTASIQSDGLWRAVETETVGQFTGLHDADGKEIYEGDVIRIPEIPSVRLVVEYHPEVWTFVLTEYTRTEGVIKGTTGIGFMLSHYRQMHVIGNIHDNPELISNSK
jgi:uncharacterized phage protein (TIGR01671 family)